MPESICQLSGSRQEATDDEANTSEQQEDPSGLLCLILSLQDHPELHEFSLFCFLEKAEQMSFKFDACLFEFTLGLPRELS